MCVNKTFNKNNTTKTLTIISNRSSTALCWWVLIKFQQLLSINKKKNQPEIAKCMYTRVGSITSFQ